ncbi:ISAs1 family transposase [Methylobacterium currus]|uniref:ISAs1 family transposase n=1 Tax=Methylobacterium currus TaxID=2051553 RepID=UPI001E3A65CA|nr:ISAs1 family transposase [Methylobacterium currus]UHC17294.1 ISAs1 family transposase [Methylobacterium currus]
MDEASEPVAAVFEATVFLDHFADLPDPRQPGKVAYRLDEVLLLALLAILAGAEGFTDIARFGHTKLDLLRRFLPFRNGTPSHDHLGDIFAALDPVAFRRCFAAWAATLTQTPLDVIAIDGKTSRRSGRAGARDALHVVSAFAARQRLMLAQTKVSGKSNEIAVIPALLDLLSIEGAIVTIDARGCQRAIAHKILDKKADYVLALKGNQGTLHEDVTLFVEEQKARDFADCTVSTHETVEGDHGRIETRRVTVIHQVAWLQARHAWPGLKSLIVVDSTRDLSTRDPVNRIERETRCYLTSSPLGADRLGPAVRQHWAIENGLHGILDVTFHDDQSRIRTAHAPENMLTVRHIAVNVAARKKGKDSMRLALKTAGWDDDYLVRLVAP